MENNSQAAALILEAAGKVLQNDEPTDLKLDRLWHTLTINRARIMALVLQKAAGPRVMDGPFKGMQLTAAAMEGVFGPILTGGYEHELHSVLERAIAHPYKRILNIGCAFGYYSVGLALRMPHVEVFAFDTSEKERQRCHDMAVLNGVAERVKIAGEFKGEDFAAFDGKTSLVLVDIEGMETKLLDPSLYPALAKLDMIVELHDVLDPAISGLITQRFAPTHNVEIIYNKPTVFDFSRFTSPAYYVHPMDSFVMAWENRSGPTPWAVMRAR